MTQNKDERLARALDEFISTSPDVEATAVVSFDGLAMASALPEDVDEDRLGAMSAALLSLGEQAATGLGRGELHQVFVEAEHGYVFLMSARDEAVLAAVAGRQAKIGLMLYEMRRAADTVGAVLERPIPAEPQVEVRAVADAPPAAAPQPPAAEAPGAAAEQITQEFRSPTSSTTPAGNRAGSESFLTAAARVETFPVADVGSVVVEISDVLRVVDVHTAYAGWRVESRSVGREVEVSFRGEGQGVDWKAQLEGGHVLVRTRVGRVEDAREDDGWVDHHRDDDDSVSGRGHGRGRGGDDGVHVSPSPRSPPPSLPSDLPA